MKIRNTSSTTGSAIKFDDILSPETPPSESKLFQQGSEKLTNVGLLIQEKACS